MGGIVGRGREGRKSERDRGCWSGLRCRVGMRGGSEKPAGF